MRRSSADLSEPLRNPEEFNETQADDLDVDLDLAMPPVEEDILEQDNRISTPPPRIAARFYRPSHARRRDSAASSRRSSMSSAQSRSASVQSPKDSDGDQSKHVAQHLRRASFLDDRRARLADRAAHGEKVRLRAALAKATPRGSSLSDERAQAAQQARERNLADIVANCAEEVKKAKQVAEFMKEKREKDNAKLRAQMEERMAEAEKRREELRHKNATRRSRGLSVVARKSTEDAGLARDTRQDKTQMTDEAATVKIQGWWRGCGRRKTMQQFNGLGLSVDGIRDTLFDTVVELLSQDKVLVVTGSLLRICGLQEGEPGSVEELAAVRTFLSAFLILGHPNQVLSNKDAQGSSIDEGSLSGNRLPSADLENPQLQDLIGKAKDLLIAFENIIARLTSSNRFTMPPALEGKLSEAYAVFYNAFIAWKSRDSNALVEVMLMQFVELDAILHTVRDGTDDAAAAVYRQSIKDSQLMLIVRIKKLAGQEAGKNMIFSAVREARKARSSKKETGDTKPRMADSSAGEVEASATATSLVSSESHNLTPPSTPAAGDSGRSSKGKTSTGAVGLKELLPDNRTVVHELAINKEYQIPVEEYKKKQAEIAGPLYAGMKATMGGHDNASLHYFSLMADSIKKKLQRQLKPDSPMFNLIGEVLDPEHMQRQFTLGNFSYEKFFSAIGSLLPKLCSPFRDDEVQDLVNNKLKDGDLVERVEALSGMIDVMLCDYINYLLRTAAPKLIDSAAQYEAKRFSEDVEKKNMSLAAAESAWRTARAKVVAEVEKRDPEGINHPKLRPTAGRFYAQLLVDVFTQPRPVEKTRVPEMLWLDMGRIEEVSTTVQRIITAGAVLLQCKNILKRDVRSPWKTEAARIMSVLEANHSSLEVTITGTMAALEAGRSMPAATKIHLRALVSKVLSASQEMSQRSVEPREPVLRLLLTRLRGNILARLAPGSATEKVKTATGAGEKLASLGLSEFVERVRKITDLLDKVGAVDRAAHGPWWDAVATKVQQDEDAVKSS